MDSPTSLLSEARRVLSLARKDRRAASQALIGLPLEAQLAVVCEAPAAQRARMLELVPDPEAVIPLIPEAELCFTVKAVGLDDSTWILEHASDAQLAACIDLDAWKGLKPDRAALAQWFAVLAEAGDDTLVRSAHAVDPEVLVLFLREYVYVMLDPNDDNWQPPDGAQTLEGQFYFLAKKDGDDLAPLVALLRAIFSADYWLYFRMMQAVIWELEGELEEFALRWRSGRLADLGFPEWDEAMRIYGFVRPEQRTVLAEQPKPSIAGDFEPAVWLPDFPALAHGEFPIFDAVQQLDDDERRAFFYGFIGLANKIAVADRMPLGDEETLPSAVEKAASITSFGLEYVATETGVSLPEVLQRTTLEHLFRTGASLDPERARPPVADVDADTDEEDGDGDD